MKPTFADALARAKRAEGEAESAWRQLADEGVRTPPAAIPSAESVVEEAVTAAMPVPPGGGYSPVAFRLIIPA